MILYNFCCPYFCEDNPKGKGTFRDIYSGCNAGQNVFFFFKTFDRLSLSDSLGQSFLTTD